MVVVVVVVAGGHCGGCRCRYRCSWVALGRRGEVAPRLVEVEGGSGCDKQRLWGTAGAVTPRAVPCRGGGEKAGEGALPGHGELL